MNVGKIRGNTVFNIILWPFELPPNYEHLHTCQTEFNGACQQRCWKYNVWFQKFFLPWYFSWNIFCHRHLKLVWPRVVGPHYKIATYDSANASFHDIKENEQRDRDNILQICSLISISGKIIAFRKLFFVFFSKDFTHSRAPLVYIFCSGHFFCSFSMEKICLNFPNSEIYSM